MKSYRLTVIAASVGLVLSASAFAANSATTLTKDQLAQGFSSASEGYKNVIFDDSSASVTVTKWQSGSNKYGFYLNGSSTEKASATIIADTLAFSSVSELQDSDLANGALSNGAFAGLNNFVSWQDGNSDLTIDVKKLTIGSDERSGDRGFQFKNSNNTLTIYADEIVAYVGDAFINAQGGDGTSIANIGSADRRVKNFEAHTTYGPNDYGVAILQANEGSKVSLYAENATLDGSHNVAGGVIGSGSYGTVLVDVSDTLTIDGNICGSYGKVTTQAGKVLSLNIKAGTLNMTGDINAGSVGADTSKFARNTVISIVADNLNLDGNISIEDTKSTEEGTKNGNEIDLVVNKSGTITGTISVSQDDGESVINLGGSGDMTASSGKFSAEEGGTIAFKDSGTWVVNEWTGTDGKLQATDSVTVEVNSAVEVQETSVAGNSTFVMNDGSKLTTKTLAGEGGSFLINTDDASVLNVTTNSNTSAKAVLSAAQNDKYATVAEARAALGKSVGETTNLALSAQEGAVSDSWSVTNDAHGNEVINVVENQKLAGFREVNSLSIFSWRHELNNLQKRMGELRDLEGNFGAWARVFGSEQEYKDAGQTNKNTTIQIGADTRIGGNWTVGGAFSYTDGSVSADAVEGDNKAYAFTAYGVWQHEQGSYVDVTARYARLDADFTSGSMNGSYDNNAYSISVEAGHKFSLSEIAFIEPQLEVIYGRIMGDDFTASNGTRIEQDDYDSLIGRLGARAGFNFPNNKGNVYARFSVVHDFDGEVKSSATNGTTRTIKDDLGGTWVEYGIGGNFRLTNTDNVYVDLERTSGGEVQQNWRWNVGFRHMF